MATIIPVGFAHIIQPYRLAAASKDFSVTYAVELGPSPRPLQTIVDEADARFRAVWRPITDSSFTFQPAEMYARIDSGPLSLVISTVAPQAGSTAKNSPPPQVAVVVRKRTSRVGRNQRGRVYLPGLLDETAVDEAGVIQASAVTTFQNAANLWLSTQNASPEDMVLLHQKSEEPPLPAPTPITQLVIQPIVRTQRRRLPRG